MLFRSSALFFNQGQIYCAGSRLFVEEKVYDEFVKKASLARADARSAIRSTQVPSKGRKIDGPQFEKVMSYIDAGKREGAEMLTGGKRVGDRGHFIEPTVFAKRAG